MSAVNTSSCSVNKELFWIYMSNLRSKIHLPWPLLGNFNEIQLPSEVFGDNFYQGKVDKFFDMINKCDLINLWYKGYPFAVLGYV